MSWRQSQKTACPRAETHGSVLSREKYSVDFVGRIIEIVPREEFQREIFPGPEARMTSRTPQIRPVKFALLCVPLLFLAAAISDAQSPPASRLFSVSLVSDTISGTAFNDLAGDAVKNLSDPGLQNWRIRLFVASLEIDSTLTASDGSYRFTNVVPGSYTVSQEVQNGWSQTLPAAGGSYSFTLLAGQNNTGTNFGNFRLISVAGSTIEDLNGNGTRDGGEPGLSGWRIRLFRGSLHTDSTLTSGTGAYSFSNLGPGTYTVSEQSQAGWTQTLPASGAPYTFAAQSGQNLTAKDFGNFRNGSISGMKFRDLNADGARQGGEPGLLNWRIHLFRGSLHLDSTLTDAGGNYSFSNVGPGALTVSEQLQTGWTQTMPGPPGTYPVTLQSGQSVTGRDFGNARNSSVRGTVFYDRNSNGSRDPGEGGLTGWTVTAAAVHPANTRSAVSQGGGLYTIFLAAADTYTITLTPKVNWTRTFPPGSAYTVVITTGTDTTGLDVGAATQTDSATFRSFTADSLLVKKAVKRRSIESKWCFDFTNTVPVSPVNGLHVSFSRLVDSITAAGPFTTARPSSGKEFQFSGAAIAPGQTVTLCGYGSRFGVKVRRWWWTLHGVIVDAKQGSKSPSTQSFLLPMPNTANFRDETFLQYFTSGMTVGTARPDARTLYGWVVIPRSLMLYNALISRGVTHTGTPSGFVTYRGRPFLSKKTTLTPLAHNNRLFADVVALKLNIASSLLGHTPPGFGELIYEEGPNLLSGMTLNQIAARADSLLTYWTGVSGSVYMNLDTVIRKVNAAFSAPMDTVSFTNFLSITGVKSVHDIPFLRPSPLAHPLTVAPATNLTEEPPETFSLSQNYPNPFNPSTTIEFDLGGPAVVTLRVYNVLGQVVATLIDREPMEDGPQGVEFDARDLASGVYFYQIIVEGIPDEGSGERPGTYVSTRKMLLVR